MELVDRHGVYGLSQKQSLCNTMMEEERIIHKLSGAALTAAG